MTAIDTTFASGIIIYYLFIGVWLLSARGRKFFTKKGEILGAKEGTFLNFMGVTLIGISVLGAMCMLYLHYFP